MTTRNDFSFRSADGKTDIAAVSWEPDGSPRAILLMTHGMQEHIGRYADFASFLNTRGFLVAGCDLLGHGHSVASPDDLGYFGENPSDTLVADMHALRQMAHSSHPGLPVFMLGHSMGSFLLRKYLALHGAGLAGAIVMGTGFTSAGATRWGLALIDALSRVLSDRHRSELVKRLAFGKAYAPFDMTGADPSRSWLSHDIDQVRAYYADPLCGFPFTLNGYRGLLETVAFSCEQANVNAMPREVPVLLASGGNDPVGNGGHGVRQVHRLMIIAGIEDLELKLYGGKLHEILNEDNRLEVYDDMASWMEERL